MHGIERLILNSSETAADRQVSPPLTASAVEHRLNKKAQKQGPANGFPSNVLSIAVLFDAVLLAVCQVAGDI